MVSIPESKNTSGSSETSGEITISPKAVSSPTIELNGTSFEFTGEAITPTVVSVKDGETVIPETEYTVSYSNNVNVGTNATVTITDNEGGNYTVNGSTTFEITNPKPVPETYTITATAGEGGSITPSGAVAVNEGADQAFTITPSEGYEIADVQVDGSSVTVTDSSYTFTNVQENHSISVTFQKIGGDMPYLFVKSSVALNLS